jgi:hypothetical protein
MALKAKRATHVVQWGLRNWIKNATIYAENPYVVGVMESRIEKYRQMAAHANLRAAKTKDTFQQRAFKQAADNWLKIADEVERIERNRTSALSRFRILVTAP